MKRLGEQNTGWLQIAIIDRSLLPQNPRQDGGIGRAERPGSESKLKRYSRKASDNALSAQEAGN